MTPLIFVLVPALFFGAGAAFAQSPSPPSDVTEVAACVRTKLKSLERTENFQTDSKKCEAEGREVRPGGPRGPGAVIMLYDDGRDLIETLSFTAPEKMGVLSVSVNWTHIRGNVWRSNLGISSDKRSASITFSCRKGSGEIAKGYLHGQISRIITVDDERAAIGECISLIPAGR